MTDVLVNISGAGGGLGADIDFIVELVEPDWPIEQVLTRQAGFSVDPYIAVRGQPVAGTPTVRTYFFAGGEKQWVADQTDKNSLELDAWSRWVPEDLEGDRTVWEGTGSRPLTLRAVASGPTIQTGDRVVTVNGKWKGATVAVFNNGGEMTSPFPGVAEYGMVFVVSLGRANYGSYGIFGQSDSSNGGGDKYASLLYGSQDYLIAVQDAYPMVPFLTTVPETELRVVAMWVSDEDKKLMVSHISRRQKVEREITTSPFAKGVAGSGKLVVGGSRIANAQPANMRVADMALCGTEGSYATTIRQYVGWYLRE